MNITLKRAAKKSTYTIGHLYVDGVFVCDTIEDEDRGLDASMSEANIKHYKVYGKTAIPTGTYKVSMSEVSPKFKSRSWAKKYNGIVPRLIGVKGFSGVLIHPGNYADYKTLIKTIDIPKNFAIFDIDENITVK